MFYLHKKFALFKSYIETHIQIDKKRLFFMQNFINLLIVTNNV